MMNDNLGLLKATLQTLALPVTGQVRLVADDCARVEVLAEAFSATHQLLHTATGTKLTPEQADALAQLDDQLAQVRQASCPPLPSELAMRTSSQWRQVRTTAREALVRFRWTLEVPPQGVVDGQDCLTKRCHHDACPRRESVGIFDST